MAQTGDGLVKKVARETYPRLQAGFLAALINWKRWKQDDVG